ncbi:MAG TPA: site-specific DNA-methyltransferase, partial [Herpetosiphonaceae bacterium]
MSEQRDQPGDGRPHPLSTLKTELVWEGKYDERGQRRQPILPAEPLPLRAAEIIGGAGAAANRLIWADNKLALQALAAELGGAAKLIYIDPPFDIGADVTMGLRLGGDAAARPALEAVAYRDAWGRGAESYPQMMYERLVLLRRLLRADGSIFVHCDWRVSAALRFILDEVFGKERLLNEIIWHYQSGGRQRDQFSHKHDTIYWYAAGADWTFNRAEIGELRGDGRRNHMKRQVDGDGRVYFTIRSAGKTYAYYGDERLTPPDVWADISHLQQRDPQRTGYATQKPEALLERIIKAASDPGDLVLDCFCGAGTALAVAEKLGRRWIGVDLGRQAIRAARKRLISVRRERAAR